MPKSKSELTREHTRVLLVFNDAWFIRGVKSVVQDLTNDEMVYRCDQHLGGPYASFDEAIDALKQFTPV